jgi:hypothetical protein
LKFQKINYKPLKELDSLHLMFICSKQTMIFFHGFITILIITCMTNEFIKYIVCYYSQCIACSALYFCEFIKYMQGNMFFYSTRKLRDGLFTTVFKYSYWFLEKKTGIPLDVSNKGILSTTYMRARMTCDLIIFRHTYAFLAISPQTCRTSLNHKYEIKLQKEWDYKFIEPLFFIVWICFRSDNQNVQVLKASAI